MMRPDNDDVEARIREFFEENLKAIQLERGYSLSPEVKEVALYHVLLYWRKLRAIAERVTDTEVRLNLPEQKTPKGRTFAIEGVVDVVRENERTVMYDLKTYDANVIRTHPQDCQKQLNVYAYIWQTLRGEALNEMAVISTAFPEAAYNAIRTGDDARLEAELERWDPVVPILFDPTTIEETIREFGAVVDQIEDGRFAPPPIEKLRRSVRGKNIPFAGDVCVNCDARFSCPSYLAYAESRGSRREQGFLDYYGEGESEEATNNWLVPALDATAGSEDSSWER